MNFSFEDYREWKLEFHNVRCWNVVFARVYFPAFHMLKSLKAEVLNVSKMRRFIREGGREREREIVIWQYAKMYCNDLVL